MTTAPRVFVEALPGHVGETVQVWGWLAARRSSGGIHFLQVRDGTGLVQAVVSGKEVDAEAFARADHLPQESSLIITGTVRADGRAPGGVEVTVRALTVFQEAAPYPITPKEHGVEFLMDHRHLWLRSPRQHAVMRVRAEVIRAATTFLDEEGFLRVDTPILTPTSVEGTTTLFDVEYFDLGKAYLAQSGQLYNEAAAAAFGRVYCFGPTFRAEKSKTRRHLIEFWMLEPEVAYLSLEGYMELAEAFVAAIVRDVLRHRTRELETLGRDLGPLRRVVPPFPRISYDDARDLLAAAGKAISWGEDFGGDEETVVSSHFDRPVFVHRYPARAKAFYMQPDPDRPEIVLSADLLAPEGYGEIIGGGERIWDPALLERRLDEWELPRQTYEWYLDLRRYGAVPHSGFGIGIERTVAWICGLEHVREAIAFPRLINRLYP